MDVREKLVELILKGARGHTFMPTETIANYLVEHGVTVQEWIPVTERLPEYEEPVMGWDAELRDMGIVNFIYGQFLDIIDMSEVNVTHWMPLPQPPKGK